MYEAKLKEVTLDPNVTNYEGNTSTSFIFAPTKSLPILAYNTATKANVITNSPYTVSLSRPS